MLQLLYFLDLCLFQHKAILISSYIYVTFVDYYLRANIEFRNKACTRGKYYSYTEVIFVLSIFIYVYRHIYVPHVLAVAQASLP